MAQRLCPRCGNGIDEFIDAFACSNDDCDFYVPKDYEIEPIVSIKPHGIFTETTQKTTNGGLDTPFIKYDQNKPLMSLIEPKFIIELGKLVTFGANKYEKDNWKKCDDVSRYKDALLRHTFAYLSGEIVDPESGIEHTIAIAFNTMALQYFDNLQ